MQVVVWTIDPSELIENAYLKWITMHTATIISDSLIIFTHWFQKIFLSYFVNFLRSQSFLLHMFSTNQSNIAIQLTSRKIAKVPKLFKNKSDSIPIFSNFSLTGSVGIMENHSSNYSPISMISYSAIDLSWLKNIPVFAGITLLSNGIKIISCKACTMLKSWLKLRLTKIFIARKASVLNYELSPPYEIES